MFYIATRTKSKWREEDAFWKSGEQTAAFIWDVVRQRVSGNRLAIELGCGIGRLAVPMSKKFLRLKMVDASPRMLEKLRGCCQQFGVGNMSCHLHDEPWWDEPADFIYSALMFQHLEHFDDVEVYIEKIARCLSGVAFLQFDTRPRNAFAAARRIVPDALLPRTQRRGIRRHRRDPFAIRRVLEQHGLRIVEERGTGTALHAFVVVK